MSAALTDSAIVSALRRIKQGQKKSLTLTDTGRRGSGRLTLVVRPGRAEWYAQRYVSGARKLEKLGNYPEITLEQARGKFAAPALPAGGASVGELFSAYADQLEAKGKPSARAARIALARCAVAMGSGKPAAQIKPGDMVGILATVYDSGAPAMADKMRMYMRAAFQWAIESAHNYKVKGASRYGLDSNPAAAIPRDEEAHRAGNRWLSADEFRALIAWCCITNRKTRQGRHIIAVTALTGQRVGEIMRIRRANWSGDEKILEWAKTKNGFAHAVPVCDRAAAILSAWPASGYHTDSGNLNRSLRLFCRQAGIEKFTVRDLRRTFKTLAGQAGITKEVRDLLQNHRRPSGDVSARHYDRYDQMPEKLDAVQNWSEWLDAHKVPALPVN